MELFCLNKTLIKTSMTAAVCLAVVTILAGIFQNRLDINVGISTFSYLGVYVIALYLSKNNTGEKIILTLIDFLAVVILVSFGVVAVQKYHGFQIVALIVVATVGTVGALWSIWLNNRFNVKRDEKQ